MTIQDMLARFRPVYAPDGTGSAPADSGGADPAAPPAGSQQIQNGGIGDMPDGGDGAEPGDAEEPDLEVDLGLDPAGEADGEEPEWEEIEHDDLKLRVPKGLSQKAKDALMLRADHTKKTQELAAEKARVEAREKVLQTRTEYDDKLNEGVFHLKAMDNALKSEDDYFRSPEYQRDLSEDYVEADKRWKRHQMNLQTRAQLAGGLQALAHERDSKLALAAEAEKQDANKRREQLPREIAKHVPGWNADRHAVVKEFAVSKLGYAPEAVESTTDPLHFYTLHLAEVGQRYLDAVARKGKGGVQAKPSKPTKQLGQRGGGGRPDPDKMTADQYRAQYLRDLQAKNGTARRA